MSVHYIAGKGFDSNVYLVDGEDPFLVDTGTGRNHRFVLESLEKITDPGRIDRIVLTHRHYDHVGGAGGLRDELGATLHIHEVDAAPLREGDSEQTRSVSFGERMPSLEVESFQEGEVFSSGERTFRVLHTPGHSAGSVVLFDGSDGSLISGDTVFAGGVGRWDLPSGDYGELVHSLRKLRELDATDLYPGHGPCARGEARAHVQGALRCLGES
ncbi:MAG: MBL fold metallo-hydrolase [Methanomassiliicoccales archaeon]